MPAHNNSSSLLKRSQAYVLCLVILYLSTTGQLVFADTILKVGVYNNPPNIFFDKSGQPAGIFIDILEEIAQKEEWEISYTKDEFINLLTQIKNGQIDLLPAIAYSKEREQFIDFNSTTVMANWAELYTAKDSNISSILELQDRKVAVNAGDIYFLALKKLTKSFNIDCRFLETDEYVTTFEMLQAGVADVAVVNRLFGEKHKLRYSVRGTSVLFSPIELRYAVQEGKNQDTTHTIDTYINRFKADENSVYYKTVNKWLMVDSNNNQSPWLLRSFYAVIGIALFLTGIVILFRSQVRRQTTELQQANKELLDQIAERQKAEKTLQRFARVIEASSDAIAFVDCNNKHVFTNESYRAITSPPTESLVGTSIIDFLGEDFFNLELKEAVADCLLGETMHIQTRPRSGHSNDYYWNLSLSPYYSATNSLVGYVVDIHDVTEHVELQNRLKNAQKMEAIGMLAGGVAHDLNNILSGLVSYPDMLLINKGPDDPMTTPLLTIKKSGERAATIVQDLLTLARRGVGTQVTTNINNIIREFLYSPEQRAITTSVTGVEYVLNLDSKLSNIKGSTVNLSKILMNFYTNGVEAMHEGGVLTISTRDVRLTKEYAGYEVIPPGNFATLTVSDTGIGMSTGEVNRVFEPFYTSKIMGRSGTGLGMAVVWGTVKDHGGYIDIKSKPGQGTTFTVYIPVTDELIVEQKKKPLHDFLGDGEEILVIDDLNEQRALTHGILENLGYEVDTAASGIEAIEKCKKKSYDLLVLDMIMPGEYDGLSTFETIKSSRPRQKAIIVSGFSETSRVKKAQALGAGIYLKKPYSVEALATAIYQELQGTA